jgi:hypothetical protein
MTVFRSRLSKYLGPVLLAIAVFASPQLCLAAGPAFLDHLNAINQVSSTVPGNGDINPYGTAVVPRSVGSLKKDHVLVSNFNASANSQGTGTTIVQISPDGKMDLFAMIDPSDPKVSGCPGGIGLTTALVVLERGWVIVGSLPTTDGKSATAMAGCLIVLNSKGKVAETFEGQGINGPWDMTALDREDRALLFVTNVLNGDVTVGAAHRVNEGTVLRIALRVPEHGDDPPELEKTTVIGSGFGETSDVNALVIGPTGVGLAPDGTLYVADTLDNRIAAIKDALTRNSSAGTGLDVSSNGQLMGPLGLAIAPNGHIITANAGDGNLVETTPGGDQVAFKTVEPAGGGSLFGLAIVPGGRGVYFVDDANNTLMVLERR